MRFVLSFLIFIHGLIHLLGFFKAFELAKMSSFSQSISKTNGVLWLLAAVGFMMCALAYGFKKEWWFLIAILSILLSQYLIFLFWKDAKFGIILNVIILLVSIVGYSNYKFHKNIATEIQLLLADSAIASNSIVTQEQAKNLPRIVHTWLERSGAIGREKINSVRLQQTGKMRTKPDGDWMTFEAQQYVNVPKATFLWSTKVDGAFGMDMIGRDKLIDGQGAMLIKLASLIPVVNESNNDKINSGAMLRYLAESVWYPSAALENYISWEIIDARSARATLTIGHQSVEGVLTFSSDGDFVSFEAQRYYGGGKEATLETWFVRAMAYKEFDGIRIPNTCEVVWKLKEGEFQWLQLEITDAAFNMKQQNERKL